MAYTKLNAEDIKAGVVFVSAKELRQRTGVSRSTLHAHIVTDKVDALRFRNRTYFHPDSAEAYEQLYRCGLLG